MLENASALHNPLKQTLTNNTKTSQENLEIYTVLLKHHMSFGGLVIHCPPFLPCTFLLVGGVLVFLCIFCLNLNKTIPRRVPMRKLNRFFAMLAGAPLVTMRSVNCCYHYVELHQFSQEYLYHWMLLVPWLIAFVPASWCHGNPSFRK